MKNGGGGKRVGKVGTVDECLITGPVACSNHLGYNEGQRREDFN